MLHHCFLDLPSSSSAAVLLRHLFSQGHCAVDVFIVLSGYCLTLPMLRTGQLVPLWPFIRRRALRILPTYYIAMALSLVLIRTLVGHPTGTNWDASIPVSARDIVLHLLLIHEWSTRSAFHINSPFWSVAVEWKIYFLFPALLALRSRTSAAQTACLALALGYGVWWFIEREGILNPSPWGSSPYYVGLFALGMWAADLSAREKRSKLCATSARAFLAALTALTLALVIINYRRDWHFIPIQILSGVVGVWAAACLALLRAGALPRVTRVLTLRPLVYLGKIGYSSYLIHAPIAQFVSEYIILRAHWSSTARALLIGPIFVALTLAIAVPFYHLFERPFHLLSRRVWRDDRMPLSIRAH
jgi:peptidoglycan/LPS O-acetylase OafA/YrhL